MKRRVQGYRLPIDADPSIKSEEAERALFARRIPYTVLDLAFHRNGEEWAERLFSRLARFLAVADLHFADRQQVVAAGGAGGVEWSRGVCVFNGGQLTFAIAKWGGTAYFAENARLASEWATRVERDRGAKTFERVLVVDLAA